MEQRGGAAHVTASAWKGVRVGGGNDGRPHISA